MRIRTRYAPSPTGFLHVGGARTALFCYLFAKKNKGDFIVRIEDTDIERNVVGGIESQLNNLAWLGIMPDESVLNPGKYGPYKQTEKLERYQTLANELLRKNLAYECFCSTEMLENDRLEAEKNHQTPRYNRRCLYLSEQEKQLKRRTIKPVIRLKISDDKNYEWSDLIRGSISFPGTSLTDPVIIKSNGICMYNFGVVVDDHDMKITHVLRGEEHIANTPYQLAINNALAWNNDKIQYGHLSIITDGTGKKLSKRNKELKQFIEDYKNDGYINSGIANFLALLGWTPPNNKEVLTMQEMVDNFDLNKLSKSPAMFDIKKMDWISAEHFKLLSNEQYVQFMKSTNKFSFENKTDDWINEALLLFKSQAANAQFVLESINNLFLKESFISEEGKMILSNPSSKLVLEEFVKEVNHLKNWSILDISNVITSVKNKTGCKGKELFSPIRVKVTNHVHGPELPKVIFLFGKDEVIRRLS